MVQNQEGLSVEGLWERWQGDSALQKQYRFNFPQFVMDSVPAFEPNRECIIQTAVRVEILFKRTRETPMLQTNARMGNQATLRLSMASIRGYF